MFCTAILCMESILYLSLFGSFTLVFPEGWRISVFGHLGCKRHLSASYSYHQLSHVSIKPVFYVLLFYVFSRW